MELSLLKSALPATSGLSTHSPRPLVKTWGLLIQAPDWVGRGGGAAGGREAARSGTQWRRQAAPSRVRGTTRGERGRGFGFLLPKQSLGTSRKGGREDP